MRWVLLLLLGACSLSEPPRPRTSAALAPMPPGARAFCNAHGGAHGGADADNCGGIPVASAMPEGAQVNAPRGWHGYCQRHPATSGCAG